MATVTPTRPRSPLAALGGLLLAAWIAAPAIAADPPEPAVLDEAFARVAAYELGQSRLPLVTLEDAVTGALHDETRRAELQRRLIALLEGSTREGRRFVCRQLARIGSAACVPALEVLLHDESEAHYARYALERMPDDAAAAALRRALDELEGPLLVGVINSVSARRDPAALAALTRLAGHADRSRARASIAAIGALGSPEAADVLLAIDDAADANTDVETHHAVADALLACGDELSPRQPGRAAALYRAVLARAGDDQRRMAAIRGLAGSEGPGAVVIIVDLLDHRDAVWRGFAAQLVRTAGREGTTEALVRAIPRLPPAQLAFLIPALGDRGDIEALPSLLAALEHDDERVRRAALRAAGTLGDGSAVTALARRAASGGEEAAIARASLRRLRADDADATMARLVGGIASPVKIELLGALGDRRAREHAGVALDFARDPEPGVRRAAFETLAQIGRPRDLPALVDLLVSAPAEPDRRAAETAVVATCLRIDDRQRRAAPVVKAMPAAGATARRSLLAVMGRIGGERALAAARDALADAELHEAAVAALAAWPDDAPAPDLMELATSLRGTDTGREALRGYVRLAGLGGSRPPEATVGMYRAALELADRSGDRRLALEGLGSVGHLEALALARAWLDEPDVAPTAALTVVAVAERVGADGHRAEALAAIGDVLGRSDDPDLRRRAGAATDRIQSDEDFVTAWLVAGPFHHPGISASDLFDFEFPPELPSPPEPVAWAELAVTRPQSPGIFDLDKAVGGGNRCAYVKTYLWSDRARTVRLELGSDDGIKVWLNDAVVHANNVFRGLTVGSDRAEVALDRGRNTLLLKITQGGGQWSFSCRVRDPLGFRGQGVRFATGEELAAPPAGATVLFDGTGIGAWSAARRGADASWGVEDGVLVVRPGAGSISTRDDFRDFLLHVGFMIPQDVTGSGQARGNSGVYLQGRYEVQILDSWESEPAANGCGAIYGRRPPRINASRPPGQWQSYLIDFTAPRYDGDDRKIRNARVTVWHNGVLVHDDVEAEGPTGYGGAESPLPGPILLQDHGNSIRFRDIWVVAGPPTWEGPEAPGFARLFDGRTLAGWRRLGGDADFRAEAGQIVGTTRPGEPNSFLCTERRFDDFVLELEFRVHPELNSGVQIRSNSFPEYEDGRVHGYQVEIDPSERAWTAGIYDEARRGWLAPLDESAPARSAFSPEGWNRLRVEARGDTLRTWLNGVAAARLVDSMTREGFIGLQVHGVGDRQDPLEVRWRDIRIRELDR